MSETLALYPPGGPGSLPARFDVIFDGLPESSPDGTIRLQRGAMATSGQRVVLKSAGSGSSAAALLRQEEFLGTHLHRVGTDRDYPGAVSRLLGFNFDGEPLTLLTTYRGTRLSAAADQLPLPAENLPRAIESLLVGLRFLAAARVVHGHLPPSTVLWDGVDFQIVDLGLAARVGVAWPRPPGPPGGRGIPGLPDMPGVSGGLDLTARFQPAWGAGPRIANLADDVYSMSLLILCIATNELRPDGEDPEGWLARQDHDLRRLLAGTFHADPARRPGARVLLERWRIPDPFRWSDYRRVEEKEQDAREHFRRLDATKRSYRAAVGERYASASALPGQHSETATAPPDGVIRGTVGPGGFASYDTGSGSMYPTPEQPTSNLDWMAQFPRPRPRPRARQPFARRTAVVVTMLAVLMMLITSLVFFAQEWGR